MVSCAASGQYVTTNLKSFGNTNLSGLEPRWAPVEATDETNYVVFSIGLYGSTFSGGSYGKGTYYTLNTNGSGFRNLHHFRGGPTDGANPNGPVLEHNASLFFGTTTAGGSNDLGTVFTYVPSGAGVHYVIHHFKGAPGDGANPIGPLAPTLGFGGIPAVTGVTSKGGSNNWGCIFKVNYDGSGFAMQRVFTGGLDGGLPNWYNGGFGTTEIGGTMGGGVLFGSSGTIVNFGGDNGSQPVGPVISVNVHGVFYLYGTTFYGGPLDFGSIYRVRSDGTGFSVLRSFQGGENGDGEFPAGGLVNGGDGLIYGITRLGGLYGLGTLFYFSVEDPVTSYRIIKHFSALDGDGITPLAVPSINLARTLFGVASQGGRYSGGTIYVMPFSPVMLRTYTNFWHFSQTGGDGLKPVSPLMAGSDGLLYGVTPAGGVANGGAVFSVTKAGTNSAVLQSFALAEASADGRQPVGGLLEASDGRLFGVTRLGGVSDSGTLFSLSRNGTNSTLLKAFSYTDGAEPNSMLIEGWDGLLYGTTKLGGNGGQGVLYRLQKDGGNFLVLHHFQGGLNDAAQPLGVIQGSDGWLYGGSSAGGSNNLGVVFKLKPDSTGFSLLHHFSGDEAWQPRASVMEASDGFLYGTTYFGGSGSAGAVFKLACDGSAYQIIANLTTSGGSASYPACALVEGSDRALYGTTAAGGFDGYGTVFRVTRNGSSLTVIKSFTLLNLGGYGPVGGLVKDTNGVLYGQTEQGGDLGQGTVFKLVPTWANQPPQLNQSIGNRVIAWASSNSFAFAANTFTDGDAGQNLSYSTVGQPVGYTFTSASRTFSGKTLETEERIVTVIATDNGSPALSAVDKFKLGVVTVPPVLTVSGSPGGHGSMGLSVQSTNGQTLVVELSTNLTTWTPLSTNTVLSNPLLLSDPSGSNRPHSFYRAIIKP